MAGGGEGGGGAGGSAGGGGGGGGNPPPVTQIPNSVSMVENFSGTERPTVEVFIKSVERAMELGNWTEKQQISIAKMKMRGAAAEYLESDTAIDAYTTWSEFKKALLDRYADKISVANATNMLANCMQKSGENVADFVTRLRFIGSKILKPAANSVEQALRLKLLNEQLSAQLQRGLKDEIRRFVLSREPTDFEEAIKIARQEEQNAVTVRRTIHAVHTGDPQSSANYKPGERPFREMFCRACKEKTHWTTKCPTFPNNCYYCGEAFHMARNCPKKRKNQQQPRPQEQKAILSLQAESPNE